MLQLLVVGVIDDGEGDVFGAVPGEGVLEMLAVGETEGVVMVVLAGGGALVVGGVVWGAADGGSAERGLGVQVVMLVLLLLLGDVAVVPHLLIVAQVVHRARVRRLRGTRSQVWVI